MRQPVTIPDTLFLLHPDSADFVHGRAEQPPRAPWRCLDGFIVALGVLFGLPGLIGVVTAFVNTLVAAQDMAGGDRTILLLILVVIGLLPALLTFLGFRAGRNIWRGLRLHRAGTIVIGALTAAKSQIWQGDGGSSLVLMVRYACADPVSGAAVEGQTSAARDDLRDAVLPTPGTPVAVLYLDDRTHRML
jgi:hypothetical protein